MAPERTDEELMLAYGRGDVRAFEALYARQKGPLYGFLLRTIGNAASADEVFQEVWSRVIGARERYRVEAKFSTWMLAIAHRLVVDHFRRQRPTAFGEEAEAILERLDVPAHEWPDARLSQFEQARRVQQALEDLPPEQREAILLRAELDLGPDGIAEVTGVGRETAKSRLRYAVAKLREKLTT